MSTRSSSSSSTREVVRRAQRVAVKRSKLDALVLVLRHDVIAGDTTYYVGLNRTDARRTARDILAGRKTIAFVDLDDGVTVPVVRTT